jgi:adenylyl cyclase-associated protein
MDDSRHVSKFYQLAFQAPLIADLIRRLEAATSRLEDIATTSFDPAIASPAPIANGTPAAFGGVVAGFPAGGSDGTSKAVEAAPVPSPVTSPPLSKPADLPEVIKDFDELSDGDLAKFITLSEALDPLLAEQAHAFKKAWNVQRQFLLVTLLAKKPSLDGLIAALQPTQEAMFSVEAVREKNRGSPWKDHLSMVSDGAGTLSWVAIEHKPYESVAELFGGAQMYGNNVLRHFKDK